MGDEPDEAVGGEDEVPQHARKRIKWIRRR
jgi:hypothetical protein